MSAPATAAEEAVLLRRYAEQGAEEAFAELVRRHIGLVHAAARRQVAGDDAAADVTQAVFTELARQARRLARHPALAGWLYTTTRHLAARHVRGETRRQHREQEAHAMQQLDRADAAEPSWEHLRPVLDAAMHDLREADRLAVLLRCFEQQPFAEVGARLGLSENAARMRVDRALDRLRGHLARRGVTSTAAALALALGGHAVATVPAGLTAGVTAGALAAGAAGSTFGILTLMASTKLKAALAAAVLVGAGTALVVQHQTGERLRRDNATLRTELARLSADVDAAHQAAADAAQRADATRPGDELLALRGEVGRLRRGLADAQKALAAKPPPPAAVARPELVEAEEPAKEATKQFGLRRLNQAKLLVLGFHLLSGENDSKPWGDLTAAVEKAVANGLEGEQLEALETLGSADFDPTYHGTLAGIANPAEAIVLRERTPWQTHEGTWARTYGFADGHSEIKASADGDFTAFEAARHPKPRAASDGVTGAE